MKVVTTYDGPSAIVHVDGRLDAEWAGQLAGTLDDLLRSGIRSALVDLSSVSYVSSAGARVLTTSARGFAALRGELLMGAPPPVVVNAFAQAGLENQLLETANGGPDGGPFMSGAFDVRSRATRDWRAPTTPVSRGTYETSAREPGATLTCRIHGDPARVASGAVEAGDCRAISFPDRTFGLGIGSLGDSYEECGPRLGELLGAAGVVAFLPTDGARVPDYLTTLQGHAPRALLASALTCEGEFSHLVRFAAARGGEAVPLSELAEVCLDSVGADVAGLVMVAESAGLVGASRQRSPAAAATSVGFALPVLREWLTFTAEPAHAGTTALITGVIARLPPPPLLPHVRPLRSDARLHGHFHAAVFSYHAVPQRTVALQSVVASLFDDESLRAMLHLVADDRTGTGVGESRFVRGFAWTAPIATLASIAP